MTEQSRPIRRRNRPVFACTECRQRKVKCDHGKPCKQCINNGTASSCTYERHPGSNVLQRTSQDPQTTENLSRVTTPSGTITGVVSKTRVYGFGHWMSATSELKGLSAMRSIGEYWRAMLQPNDDEQLQEIAEKVAQCKAFAREVKRQRPSRQCGLAEIHRLIPARGVTDTLIDLYFSTFESCYRILHRPRFMTEYGNCIDRLATAETSFLLQLLLIVSITWPLHPDKAIRSELAENTQIWIHLAQTWLSAPLEKDRLTLKGVQVYCLLLLAQQVSQVGADLVWISAGSLLRMAMQMGMHQDPSHLGDASVIQSELRRRLWYTILELNVQSALDSGMPPMITEGSYNTRIPMAISDEDLDGAIAESLVEPVSSDVNQASLQSLLAKSLPLRAKIATVINSMNEEPSYEQILVLGEELHSASQQLFNTFNQRASTANLIPSARFTHSHCTHLLRRFSLCLHFRYALNAQANPLYDFSRRMAVEAALDIVSLLEDELYSRLLIAGSGMFRDILTRAALLVFLELAPERGEDASIFSHKRHRSRQESLLQDSRNIVEYSRERMYWGETNIRVYVCLSMMLAQATARFEGQPADVALSKAFHESLDECNSIMKAMMGRSVEGRTQPEFDNLASEGLSSWTAAVESEFSFLDDMSGEFDFPWGGS